MAATVTGYLAKLDPSKRAALQKLRRTIKSAAPGAEEIVSYGMPAFRLNGRILVWYGAGKDHCAFYPGAHPIAAHTKRLARYETSKGTIRFEPDHPMPASLVRALVKTRIAERARPRTTRS
ncbi:MAG TPA: DUF1801 domain-containing protein [Vicinamibacterales bacterium]|nr:DUF1801 domain-containing protein [Vicinamibacterales bacterium]